MTMANAVSDVQVANRTVDGHVSNVQLFHRTPRRTMFRNATLELTQMHDLYSELGCVTR